MSEYKIQDTTLTGIADAVRNQTGSTASYSPAEMTSNINNMYILRGPDVSANMTEDIEGMPYCYASVDTLVYRNNVSQTSYVDTSATVTLYHKASTEENYTYEGMWIGEGGYQYISGTLAYSPGSIIDGYVVVEPSLTALGTYTSPVYQYEVPEPPEDEEPDEEPIEE